MGQHERATDSHSTNRFAERFELHELLGTGGMAAVYRATDLSSGQTVALKRLTRLERDAQRGHVELLFEREFHTLSQLSHPHVIAVYDYGVTPDGTCYYTMELLDGGALRDRAPLPWREACRLLFDVCSSLALLHSRRLLHRDVSPRNVHCTQDGHAKLIDFGAVTPMSANGGDLVVGTPAFTAPETVQRSATDGRTDLYSLGATLYYVLTGELAYPARSFAELRECWDSRPPPPSAYVEDIPATLDDLVMSLLDLSPALRPQSDWPGAEKLQRSAELLALRARVPQLFVSSLTVEISAHALALDLAGVQDVIERERVEAAAYPGWIPYVREAEARFELIRGDLERAKVCFDETIAMTALDASFRSPALPVWIAAQSGLCEVLIGLGRLEEARESALAALSVCEQLDIRSFSNDIVRTLALAEAKLGDFATAAARLDKMIAAQNELGVTGLRLGLSYEARADVALWSEDVASFDHYARLTAREYRYGAGCPLSARYERLTREARNRGIQPLVGLNTFEPTTEAATAIGSLTNLRSVVRDALATTQHQSVRCERALRLACEHRSALGGHLYLTSHAGPRLVASVERPKPGRGLEESVRDYLEEQADRFETQTVALTDLAPAMSAAPTAALDGVEYELELLSYQHEGNAKIVGVLALVPGRDRGRHPRQALLLASIAEHLGAPRTP